MPAPEPSDSEVSKDYPQRNEELTGFPLWQCPVFHQGRMLVIEILANPCSSIGLGKNDARFQACGQEALTNAIKHGHAKTIVIGLRQTSGGTLLTVTNDGPPLPPDSEHRGGMGLQITRYRADMIGATLLLESTHDGKTAVVCSFGSSPPDDCHSARIFQGAAKKWALGNSPSAIRHLDYRTHDVQPN